MPKKSNNYLCMTCYELIYIECKYKYPYIYHNKVFCSYACMKKYKDKIKRYKMLGLDVKDEERNED